MAGPELIPSRLPKLPTSIPAPYHAALQSVVLALRNYQELRQDYQQAARVLRDHDVQRREQLRLRHELAERQVSLTERVKRRPVREHSEARDQPPGEGRGR